MAQVRKTTYLCDSCGKEVPTKKDLRTFQVVPKGGSGYDYGRSVKTDLCGTCEDEFVEALVRFAPDEERETVESYRRPTP